MSRKKISKNDNLFGERLKAWRKSAGLKQYEIADKLGLASGYMSEVESGKKTLSQESLKSLKENFLVSIDYLLTGEEDQKETNLKSFDNIDLSKFQSPDSRLEELSQEEKTLLLKVLLEDREDHRERLKILEDYIEYLRGILEKNQIEHYPLNKRSGTGN